MGEYLAATVEDDVVGHEIETQLGEQGLLPHATIADTAPFQRVALEITTAVGRAGINTNAQYLESVAAILTLQALQLAQH